MKYSLYGKEQEPVCCRIPTKVLENGNGTIRTFPTVSYDPEATPCCSPTNEREGRREVTAFLGEPSMVPEEVCKTQIEIWGKCPLKLDPAR